MIHAHGHTFSFVFLLTRTPGRFATCADHYNLLQSAEALVNLLTTGAEGPRWQLAEARRLLGLAQRALALSRPGLLKDIYSFEKAHLAHKMGEVEGAAASFPGQQLLPALLRADMPPVHFSSFCSACGKKALTLRACAACRAVSYCSKECQVRKRTGGLLAAARSGDQPAAAREQRPKASAVFQA